jgi:hypothetical protein
VLIDLPCFTALLNPTLLCRLAGAMGNDAR